MIFHGSSYDISRWLVHSIKQSISMEMLILQKADQTQTLSCSLQLDPVGRTTSEQAPECTCYSKAECKQASFDKCSITECPEGSMKAECFFDEAAGEMSVCKSCETVIPSISSSTAAEHCKEKLNLFSRNYES